MRTSSLAFLWFGYIAIATLSLEASNPVDELEIPTWSTVDFYDAIERDDAIQVQAYLSDKTRATREFLSYYLLDFALELDRDEIAQLMVEAGAGVNTLSAVQHENVQILKELLERGVEPRGASLAAEQGNIQMLELLLKHGAKDLNTEGAARSGQLKALTRLLDHGAEPDGVGFAILFGHKDSAKLLLESGANTNELTMYSLHDYDFEFDLPSRYYREYLSPLHYAVLSQSLELVELLLEKGADPNIALDSVTLQHNHSRLRIWPTILQTATDHEYGDARIVQLLKESGASSAITAAEENVHLERKLYYAADQLNYKLVVQFLEQGAQPTGFGEFYYGFSEQQYDPKIVTAFLKAGADPNVYSANHGAMYTPAALTLHNGDADNFQRLVKAGIETTDMLLYRYLVLAASNGFNEVIDLLWNLGCPRSTLELLPAVNRGHVHTVKFLVAKGIRPEFLRHAVEREHNEIVKMLLEAGADPNEPDDHDERSILEIAMESENEEMTNLLKKAGAEE